MGLLIYIELNKYINISYKFSSLVHYSQRYSGHFKERLTHTGTGLFHAYRVLLYYL